MEVKIIDAAAKNDVRLKNEAFPLYGRMVPSYRDGVWGYEIKLFPEGEVSEQCFPDSGYDFDAAGADTVFVGAYDGGACIGLAVLKDAWFNYMYLDDLKISGRYRGKGAAKALVEKAKEVALARGYRGIYTIGQDNNLSACKFYLKTGFQIGGFDNHVYKGTSQEGKADIIFYLDI